MPEQSPLHPEPPRAADAAVRSSQLVSLILIIGLLIGGGTLGFMGLTRAGVAAGGGGPGGGPAVPVPLTLPKTVGTDVYSILVPILAAIALAVVVWVPPFMARQAKKRWESRADDEAAMRRVYQGFMTLSVFQGAALEAPGLLGAVATLLTGNWLMLLATLGSVVLLAVLFPRTGRIDRWIDEVTGNPPPPDAYPTTPVLADDEAA